MPKNLSAIVAWTCLLVVANQARALNEDAPVIHFGGVSAYPGVAVVGKYDSNITQQPDNDPGKITSKVMVLSPEVILQAEKNANKYSFIYSADIGQYSNSSKDNYVDQHYVGLAEFGLSSRSVLKFQPEYLIGHDDRGSTFASAIGPEPNLWHSTLLAGSFSYGAEEARGHLDVDLGYTDIQFRNNVAVTDAYNRNLTNEGGTFYFRVLPKTSVLVNARHTGISYKLPGSELNGNEQQLRAGIKWEATALTKGEVQIGALRKTFDASTSPMYSGSSWQADVLWSPLTFVDVNLLSSKQASESTLVGSSALIASNSGANVSYKLNDRLTLQANGFQLKQDFVGTNRSDTTNTFGLKAEFKMHSWMIGGEYTNDVKNSSDPGFDFKRSIFTLSVRSPL
ncbi:MAG: outer membrane beta-barrel protein [Gallionella sp.]